MSSFPSERRVRPNFEGPAKTLRVRPDFEGSTKTLRVRPDFERSAKNLRARPDSEGSAKNLRVRPDFEGQAKAIREKMAQYDVDLKNFSNIFSLAGKTAVVTGGSRGLGLHAASGLLQAGCSKVYITSRKTEACEEACKVLNALPDKPKSSRAIPVPADSSKVSEIERLVEEVKKTTDHIDILFANAGATWGAPLEKHDDAAFSKVMNLNVKSVFFTVQKFAPLLSKNASRKDPSRVVATASVAGLGIGSTGEQSVPAYSASKAAVIHLMRHLAVDLGDKNILCNAIAPGFFPSRMANGLIELSGGADKMAEKTPNRRIGSPEDIAGTVVYLCSRASSHSNGSVIALDGGRMWARSEL